MSEFADYRPERGADPEPTAAVRIGDARPDDLEPIVAILARREGSEPDEFRVPIAAQLSGSDETCRIFVARLDGEVVAYSLVARLSFETIPEGWYLAGVVVSPAHRRRGIGRALTEHRIRWISSRTGSIHYFVNERNRASIDLHAALGFREIRRGITVPNCRFEGGVGVLFRLDVIPGGRSG